jgi:gamma-glutamylcyclotransferase (GGCT)/AIG2-like uncharacterized protein YtfP
MSQHCFTYGSLMCADIMARVAGSPAHAEPATLHGYARHPVRGEEYPGMVPAPRGTVSGVLYRALPDAAWARLDAFEGDRYARRQVSVILADGRSKAAWTYVFKPEHAHLLATGEWDFAAFLGQGKARFEALYLGFDKLP